MKIEGLSGARLETDDAFDSEGDLGITISTNVRADGWPAWFDREAVTVLRDHLTTVLDARGEETT